VFSRVKEPYWNWSDRSKKSVEVRLILPTVRVKFNPEKKKLFRIVFG
jgi:hypothetical protein